MTKAQRAAISARLDEIAARHRGRLTPKDVVADAKNKDSPLHGQFEWNVRKAAMEHWLEQARELIRSVKVVVEINERTYRIPSYVRDPRLPEKEQGYVETATIRNDKDTARDVLLEEFGRAEACLARAIKLSKYFSLEKDIKKVRERVLSMRQRVQTARV